MTGAVDEREELISSLSLAFGGQGSSSDLVVDFLTTYSNRPDLLNDLERATQRLDQAAHSAEPDKTTSVHVIAPAYKKHYTADRLGEQVVKSIIEDFEAGTARHILATRHGISVRTVGRLLKRHREGRNASA